MDLKWRFTSYYIRLRGVSNNFIGETTPNITLGEDNSVTSNSQVIRSQVKWVVMIKVGVLTLVGMYNPVSGLGHENRRFGKFMILKQVAGHNQKYSEKDNEMNLPTAQTWESDELPQKSMPMHDKSRLALLMIWKITFSFI